MPRHANQAAETTRTCEYLLKPTQLYVNKGLLFTNKWTKAPGSPLQLRAPAGLLSPATPYLLAWLPTSVYYSQTHPEPCLWMRRKNGVYVPDFLLYSHDWSKRWSIFCLSRASREETHVVIILNKQAGDSASGTGRQAPREKVGDSGKSCRLHSAFPASARLGLKSRPPCKDGL